MKQKIFFAGAFTLLSVFSFAQDAKENVFEIEAKGLGNSTWLFNKNISDRGDEQDYASAFGFNYGLAFNAYFGKVGVGVEALMGNHKGGYAGTIEFKDSAGTVTSKMDYTSSVNLQTIQIPVLFKLKSEMLYMEIGPQYNLISSATYRSKTDNSSEVESVTKDYSSSYFSAVLGFGARIKFGESPLGMNIGIRLQYSLSDLKGVDAWGQDLNNSLYYKDKASTTAATGGLVIGFAYRIGEKK